MNELAELLLLVILLLPPMAGVVAAIPGSWWPDARRPWFSTFACLMGAAAAGVIASSPLWREMGLQPALKPGTWSTHALPAEIDGRLSLDPSRAMLVFALMAAGFALSLGLARTGAATGRRRTIVACLLAATSCATISILASNLLMKAIAMTACTVVALLPLGRKAGSERLPVEGDGDSTRLDAPDPRAATLLIADGFLYFALLVAATTAGTLDLDPLRPADGFAAKLAEQPGADRTDAERASARAAATWTALGVFMAVAARLALFPLLFQAVDHERTEIRPLALLVATVVPAAGAFAFSLRPVLDLAPDMQRLMFACGGLTLALGLWGALVSATALQSTVWLLAAGNGAIFCAAVTGDPRALVVSGALLAVQSCWGAARLWNLCHGARISSDRADSGAPTSAEPRAHAIVQLGRRAFHTERIAAAAIAAPWRLLARIALSGGRLVSLLGTVAVQKLHAFCAAVLEELEGESARFHIVVTLLACGILGGVLLLG